MGWRMCVSGCPYKKVYFNWSTAARRRNVFSVIPGWRRDRPRPVCIPAWAGFAILACSLYDADRIEETAKRPDDELVDAQRDMILDPFDPQVIREARGKTGVDDKVIESAQKSPVYSYVKRWKPRPSIASRVPDIADAPSMCRLCCRSRGR